MRWFQHRVRGPDHASGEELERIAADAEQSAAQMSQDVRDTVQRVNPSLAALERAQKENGIYTRVLMTLRGVNP